MRRAKRVAEVTLMAEAARVRDVAQRSRCATQQRPRLLEAALPEIVGRAHAHMLTEHARQVHRVHTGRVRDVGNAVRVAERVVEMFTRDAQPGRGIAGMTNTRSGNVREQLEGECVLCERRIATASCTHARQPRGDRHRVGRIDYHRMLRQRGVTRRFAHDVRRQRDRQKPSIDHAIARLEPVAMRRACRIEDQLRASAHRRRTVGRRDVESIQHEDEVRFVVGMTLHDAVRIGPQQRQLDTWAAPTDVFVSVETAEGQNEVTVTVGHGGHRRNGREMLQRCKSSAPPLVILAVMTTLTPTAPRRMTFRSTIAVCLLTAVALATRASAQSPVRAGDVRANDDLLGLWGSEQHLGPQVHGALHLERHGTAWSLRVAGFEARATQRGDSVVLALAGGQGALKLWIRATGPDAFWVQPSGVISSYATPVRLERESATRWRGVVTPVPEQFSLYLMVTRSDDGTLRGTFRNPDVNWSGRIPWFTVSRVGDNVVFTNPRTRRAQYTQPYDSARRTITFDFGTPFVLVPRTRDHAVGFVTRSPSLAPYTYRVPALLRDGWTTANAARVRMDTVALQSIVRALVAVDPLSDTAPRIHALVVARDGQLVLDEYFRGYDADMVHDLRSASKTMTSIMAGAAMQRGATINGAPLSAGTLLGRDGITLGHLLSHSAGLACNDDDDKSPGNEDTMQSQQVQNDWYAFFMALPRVTSPGSTYSYCSAGINMAGGMVARATQQWLPRLFDAALARPMSFGDYGINLMPTGDAYSGGGMRMRPRDLLKFGELYRNAGRWRGAQLVPASWVKASTAHVISRPDSSDDGYGWHRHVLTAHGRQYQTYSAGGNGGQFLLVVPELRLSIAVTAGNYGQYDVWTKIRTELVPAIMAAAR